MLDEMIELFSVMNQLEKGALGLFFEMNYLVGVILSIYISWFIFSFDPPKLPSEEDMKDKKYEAFERFFKTRYVEVYKTRELARTELASEYE